MLIIKNGIVYTMAGRILNPGDILIENDKIVEISENITLNADKNDTIIDATGLWVLPGIIEAHCHIGLSEEKKGPEDDDCNEVSSPITPDLRAFDAVNTLDPAFHNALQAGITSVMVGPGSTNVVGGQFAFIKTHGRVVDKMIVLAPAAMKVSFGENPKNAYKSLNKQPTSRMTIASLLRQELFEALNYKTKKENALGNNEQFEENYKIEPWIPVLNREIPLKAHVHRASDILTAIRIAKEFKLNMTLDHCSEGHIIVDEIKASGFAAIVGPSISSRDKIEIENVDFKTPGILAKAGILVAITSDHPVTLIQYLPLYAGLAVKKGMEMMEGLKAITINPAIICGVDSCVGSIEIGKDADISIFSGNPMETFTETIYTIVNGKIVYKRDEQI